MGVGYFFVPKLHLGTRLRAPFHGAWRGRLRAGLEDPARRPSSVRNRVSLPRACPNRVWARGPDEEEAAHQPLSPGACAGVCRTRPANPARLSTIHYQLTTLSSSPHTTTRARESKHRNLADEYLVLETPGCGSRSRVYYRRDARCFTVSWIPFVARETFLDADGDDTPVIMEGRVVYLRIPSASESSLSPNPGSAWGSLTAGDHPSRS